MPLRGGTRLWGWRELYLHLAVLWLRCDDAQVEVGRWPVPQILVGCFHCPDNGAFFWYSFSILHILFAYGSSLIVSKNIDRKRRLSSGRQPMACSAIVIVAKVDAAGHVPGQLG